MVEHSEAEASLAEPSDFLDPEASLPSLPRVLATPPNPPDLESSGYSLGLTQTDEEEIDGINAVMEAGHIGLGQELAACQDSGIRLKAVHEHSEEEVGGYSPMNW